MKKVIPVYGPGNKYSKMLINPEDGMINLEDIMSSFYIKKTEFDAKQFPSGLFFHGKTKGKNVWTNAAAMTRGFKTEREAETFIVVNNLIEITIPKKVSFPQNIRRIVVVEE